MRVLSGKCLHYVTSLQQNTPQLRAGAFAIAVRSFTCAARRVGGSSEVESTSRRHVTINCASADSSKAERAARPPSPAQLRGCISASQWIRNSVFSKQSLGSQAWIIFVHAATKGARALPILSAPSQRVSFPAQPHSTHLCLLRALHSCRRRTHAVVVPEGISSVVPVTSQIHRLKRLLCRPAEGGRSSFQGIRFSGPADATFRRCSKAPLSPA